jgi:nucleoside phosphorylase
MVGICAGVRGKVEIGDIIFADPVWDYQSGKVVKQGDVLQFDIAPHQVAPAESLRARFEQMKSDSRWLADIRAAWPLRRDSDPRLHIGPVASGSAVLADGDSLVDVRSQQRQLLGVDMELYGLYCAAMQANRPEPLFFGIKSVCDFADEHKSDDEQAYAAYTSACTLRQFIERHYFDVTADMH